jgi:16S rRNA (guanine966-N2)-methyltransferase
MIKIIGGFAKGFPLATPRSETTRPTSVLIRRKLFDWRQNLSGFQFIDICAGSGAMGFEALSRGAERVFLNDSHRGAFLILKQNQHKLLGAFNFSPDSVVLGHSDARQWIQRELKFHTLNSEHTILFLDPPYQDHLLYTDLLRLLSETQFEGEIWLESDKLKGPKKEDLACLFQSVIKTMEHGDHFVMMGKLK